MRMLPKCYRITYIPKLQRHLSSTAEQNITKWPGWEVVIGVEVHAQIKSRRKLFSGLRDLTGFHFYDWYTLDATTTQLSSEPNTFYSATDAAWPGSLPVKYSLLSWGWAIHNNDLKKLNKSCVDLAVRTALACKANVQLFSTFDRKHYFYADLPAGYQITQKYGEHRYVYSFNFFAEYRRN